MWWVTLQEKQTKTNMAPTSKLRRIQQTLTVSLYRWPAQKIDKNSTFHLDGHTVGFSPQNHLPRPPSTPTGYRVQRKSVLQLTIPASWSQYVLGQKSFQIAGKKFLMNRIDYGFSAFECPPPKKNLQQPIGQVKNSIHQPDNKIYQTLAQYRTVKHCHHQNRNCKATVADFVGKFNNVTIHLD